MSGDAPNNVRSLAQIEGDLLKAEAAYTDADHRLSQAERDRRAALDTINRHQMEFDEAIAKLRRRSAAGSRWRLGMEEPDDGTLILQTQHIAQEVIPPHAPAATPGLTHIRLRPVAQSERRSRS